MKPTIFRHLNRWYCGIDLWYCEVGGPYGYGSTPAEAYAVWVERVK